MVGDYKRMWQPALSCEMGEGHHPLPLTTGDHSLLSVGSVLLADVPQCVFLGPVFESLLVLVSHDSLRLCLVFAASLPLQRIVATGGWL